MKIAYVTTYDPADVQNWSGLGANIRSSLLAQNCEVDSLGPLPRLTGMRGLWLRAAGIAYNRMLRARLGKFSDERDPGVARFYAKTVMERLKGRYDVIVSPGTIPVAFVKSEVPIAIWADATFRSLVTTYQGYGGMTKAYYRDGEALEHQALARASLCVFSSEWAAQSAIRDYGADERKVKVIPFGANVEEDQYEDVDAAIATRDRRKVTLLFVGYDFVRKGGPKLLQILRELHALRIAAELDIIGCTPEIPEKLKAHVRVHGILSKKTSEGRECLAKAFLCAHWLVLLSEAECYGLVLAEANRYGVPCISNRVGGIPTIIRDNHNGKLFPAGADARDIAAYIAGMSLDRSGYTQMAINAFAEYRTRLNWRVAGSRFVSCLNALIASRGNEKDALTAPSGGRSAVE